MKIAVDAMGGDYGPAVVVEGAVTASREYGSPVILIGDKAAIEREVMRLGAESPAIEVRHASQVVGGVITVAGVAGALRSSSSITPKLAMATAEET